jgi:ribosomal protein S18 acetylase RimI-like enzyme
VNDLDTPVLTIDLVDYRDPRDGADLVMLLDAYACDPMGGGEPLSDEVRDMLPRRLADVAGAFSLIARLDDRPVALANCFTLFSTFAAEPLINVHDVAVLEAYRGRGLARALMARVEEEAKARGACKITLEVLSGNLPAQSLYRDLGYGDYVLDPAVGQALFWQKKL